MSNNYAATFVNFSGPYPLCYKKSALLNVPAEIWYQHGWCDVHPYYRKTKIAYAYCG